MNSKQFRFKKQFMNSKELTSSKQFAGFTNVSRSGKNSGAQKS